jgi:hypothetical protein
MNKDIKAMICSRNWLSMTKETKGEKLKNGDGKVN